MTFKIIELEQGSAEWKEFRADKIGGSDIASVLDLPDAYKSRSELLDFKITGEEEEPSDFVKQIMAAGHAWEPVVRKKIEEQRKIKFTPVVVQSTDNEFFIASLDGYNEKTGLVLEVKSTTSKAFDEYKKDAKFPPKWLVQLQWQMMIVGAEKGILAVVQQQTGEMVHHEIVAEPETQTQLVAAAERFLEEMTLPSPFQEIDDSTMEHIKKTKANIDEYKKLLKLEEERLKRLAESVLDLAGAERVEGSGVKIEWQERDGSVDYSKVPELVGVDLEKYRKNGSRFVKVTVVNKNKQKQIGEEVQ